MLTSRATLLMEQLNTLTQQLTVQVTLLPLVLVKGGSTTSIKLAASDTQANNFYNGMRITITDGTGSGQTGYVGTYTAATKTATMFKEDGSAGFDVFGPTSVAVGLNATSSYEIEPRVTSQAVVLLQEMH